MELTLHGVATKERKEIKGKTKQIMEKMIGKKREPPKTGKH